MKAGRYLWDEVEVRLLTCVLEIFPSHRNSRPVGPGVEMREDPIERKRRSGEEVDAYTALE